MQKHLFILGLLMVGIAACQTPVTQQAQQIQATHIPGRLILQTADQRQLVLSQASLQFFSGSTELAKVSVMQNLFQLPLLKALGPYTYQGQGTIERIQEQAVPIGGSQGGIVPIGGSQGGLHHPDFTLLNSPSFSPGQTIRFEGQIQDDLRQTLPQLDLKVPVDKMTIIANQAIINQNSDITNSNQVVIPGNTQGNVTIGNGTATANQAPRIQQINISPPGPVAAGATITLQADAQDPEGNSLQYEWQAERGTLSADRGVRVTWTAQDAQGSLPPQTTIKLTVKDNAGGVDTAQIGLIIQTTK